jgi:hypothetical protein
MSDIQVAIDEAAANIIVPDTIASLPAISLPGQGSLGPFGVSWVTGASISGTGVDLIPLPANVIRIGKSRINFEINGHLRLDLGFLDFCLPRHCITIPWFHKKICLPRVCFHFPTISVPFSFASHVDLTIDLHPSTYLANGVWHVDAVVAGTPTLNFGPAAGALISILGAVASAALLAVPMIGVVLSLAMATLTGAFTVGNVTGLLGQMVTPFVNGLRVPLYSRPQAFEVQPATAQDPAARISLDSVAAVVQHNGSEDELVLRIDISPL